MKQLQSLKSDLHQSRIVLQQLGEDIQDGEVLLQVEKFSFCLLYTSPSPRDQRGSRMPSSA